MDGGEREGKSVRKKKRGNSAVSFIRGDGGRR